MAADKNQKVEVDHLVLSHTDAWRLIKYDDTSEYQNGIKNLHDLAGGGGTKAVDLVGVHGTSLYLIELKNFRGHRIKNKHRLGQPLANEVALKMRDTLAGVLGAYQQSNEPSLWRPVVDALVNPNQPVVVRLILDRDRAPSDKAAMSALLQELKKQLRWLTTKVNVVSSKEHGLPELEIGFLSTGKP